jgi:hypothetical protein
MKMTHELVLPHNQPSRPSRIATPNARTHMVNENLNSSPRGPNKSNPLKMKVTIHGGNNVESLRSPRVQAMDWLNHKREDEGR